MVKKLAIICTLTIACTNPITGMEKCHDPKSTDLHTAAFNCSLNELKNQIISRREKKQTIDPQNSMGQTPFLYAIQNSQLEAAQILLKEGASKNKVDNQGNNAWHYAAESGDRNNFIFLLENGISNLVQNEEGQTPAHIMAATKKSGYLEQNIDRAVYLDFLIQKNSLLALLVTNDADQTPVESAIAKANILALAVLSDKLTDSYAIIEATKKTEEMAPFHIKNDAILKFFGDEKKVQKLLGQTAELMHYIQGLHLRLEEKNKRIKELENLLDIECDMHANLRKHHQGW